MLKTLLADRFGLKVHTGSKEVNVYAMTVVRLGGKLGPKMQPWNGKVRWARRSSGQLSPVLRSCPISGIIGRFLHFGLT
jgi:uncharacterized protein (TIGR03435 family)